MSEKFSRIISFFTKHLETIGTLIGILCIIIFCVVYQPKIVQPILDLIGLKKIDANTPVEIDKAIVHFTKKANKKIPKGSYIIVRKADLKTPNNAIKENIHWKIMQHFTECSDINVYDNKSFAVKDNEEIFTISARLEEFYGVTSKRLFDGDEVDYYDYKFYISLDKDGRNILMIDYAINDENLGRSKYSQEPQTEEVVVDSLTEQECIMELEESLSSFYSELDGCTEGGLLYKGYKKMNGEKGCSNNEKIGKQIEIMLNKKNCNSIMCECIGEMNIPDFSCAEEKCEPCTEGECPYNCKHKSKCFSYDYQNFDACGGMSMKSNIPIKGCPVGSVWTYKFCSADKPCYSVPENPACKIITHKRVKDNTTCDVEGDI